MTESLPPESLLTRALAHFRDEPEACAWLWDGFVPVPRGRARRDGWGADAQWGFLAVLAFRGVPALAAAAVGRSRPGAYRLRAAPGAERFAAAWDRAVEHGEERALAAAHAALAGSPCRAGTVGGRSARAATATTASRSRRSARWTGAARRWRGGKGDNMITFRVTFRRA